MTCPMGLDTLWAPLSGTYLQRKGVINQCLEFGVLTHQEVFLTHLGWLGKCRPRSHACIVVKKNSNSSCHFFLVKACCFVLFNLGHALSVTVCSLVLSSVQFGPCIECYTVCSFVLSSVQFGPCSECYSMFFCAQLCSIWALYWVDSFPWPIWQVEVLLYVHRNRRFIRDRSPGRPELLSSVGLTVFIDCFYMAVVSGFDNIYWLLLYGSSLRVWRYLLIAFIWR